MSVFNEIKVLTTSTAINICNSNNNLSPDFLERNTPNKTTLNEINESIIILNDNDGGEATPTTPVANNSNSSTPNANSKVQQKNPKLYKTELCRSWMETGRCNYGERCQYAHGDREKRPVPRHPKYKTEPCQSYHKTGYCPYGPRCHFIHNENPNQLKALINANEQALRLGEFPPSGQDTKQQRSILTSSCSAASLGAYAAAMQSVNNINNNSNNNATGTPPIFSSGKMTPNGNCGGMSLFPAQRSNSAIVAYLNGQQHLLGKTQGFGSNPDNYNMFNNNMHLCQNSPPPLYDQQQQQNCQQQQYVNNLNFDETHIGNYSETNNLKSLWHETGRDVEFSLNNNCNQGLMVDHSNTFRPKTLDLFSPHATGWHSEQISPLHFSSIPYIHGEDSTENFQQQQQCHQRKILPVPLNTQKQHFLDFNDVGYENNELDAQQLLGNLCCASDDEYSRSSIISSNIDSGNESPPAASEDSANNKIIINSQQSSALFDLDESQEQQRRSSEGDDITATTTPINKNGDSHPLTTSSTQQQTIQNNETNIYNKSTASSSLASLLSSSSSNSANLIPQKSIIGDSEIFLLKSNNNKNNTSLNSTIPSSTPYLFSHVTGINVTTKAENNTQEKKATTQQQQASSSSSSVRLPVFERLSLNQ